MFAHLFVYCPYNGSCLRNNKALAEVTLTQCWKDIVGQPVKLRLCNVVTTFVLRWYNVATTSFFKFVTTLSTDVGETFTSNEMTASLQSIARWCNNVLASSLFLLGIFNFQKKIVFDWHLTEVIPSFIRPTKKKI